MGTLGGKMRGIRSGLRRRHWLGLALPMALTAAGARAQMYFDNLPPPIFGYIRDGDVEGVRRVLLTGDNSVNQIDRRGIPAIVAAAAAGHPAVMNELLGRRPIVDQTDPQKNTALIVGAKDGHAEIVRMLLVAGARVNAQNRFGNTALMQAAAGGWIDVVQVILRYRPDQRITDYTGRTALDYARENGHVRLEPLLDRALIR